MCGYLKKGMTPIAQGRSTKIISMIQWIRTSRLSINNSLSPGVSEMVIAFGVPDGGTVSNAMRNSHV